MFCKYDTVYNYFEENLDKREEKDMALADLIPGVVEKLIEQGRKEQLKRILIKKLKSGPSKEIIKLIEEATEEKINEVEDKIFEIESWEEVEKCLIICYF